jgi:hypothetical protein
MARMQRRDYVFFLVDFVVFAWGILHCMGNFALHGDFCMARMQ